MCPMLRYKAHTCPHSQEGRWRARPAKRPLCAEMALGGPDSRDRHQRRSGNQTEEAACAKAHVTESEEGRRWGHGQWQLGNLDQTGSKEEATEPGWRGGAGRGQPCQGSLALLKTQGMGPHLEGDDVLPGEGLVSQQVSEVLGLDIELLHCLWPGGSSCYRAYAQPGIRSLQPARTTAPSSMRKRTEPPGTPHGLRAMALPLRGKLVEPQKLEDYPLSKVPHRTLS